MTETVLTVAERESVSIQHLIIHSKKLIEKTEVLKLLMFLLFLCLSESPAVSAVWSFFNRAQRVDFDSCHYRINIYIDNQ